MILHPGVVVALRRLGSDELGIAKLMAAGDITSPQHYANITLFVMRVTGSGVAYRRAHDEYTFRDPALYCNDEFLARCNGLPVVWEHPEKQTLDAKEFADRIIGTVFLPYVVGDEVWCIAKIWDGEAALLMEEGKLSTSPAVVFHDPSVNERMAMEDGSTLLIEGKPSLIDHLAVCTAGVWDKGNPPNGIRADSDRTTDMTEEEKLAAARKEKEREEAKDDSKKADATKADTAKKDENGDDSAKLDRLMSMVSGLVEAVADSKSRLDAQNARMDAMDKDRVDSARKDEMSQPSKEEREVSERQAKVETEQEKERDKAGVGDAKKDAKRAEEGKGEAEKSEKRDDARADADMADIRRQLADLQTRSPRLVTDADHVAMAAAQSRADAAMNLHGKRASIPLLGETPLAYRLRMASELKRFSPRFAKTDLTRIVSADPELFGHLEDNIYADAEIAGHQPLDLDIGELREVRKTNHDTGGMYREFKGRRTFVAAMSPVPRPVTNFGTRQTT